MIEGGSFLSFCTSGEMSWPLSTTWEAVLTSGCVLLYAGQIATHSYGENGSSRQVKDLSALKNDS